MDGIHSVIRFTLIRKVQWCHNLENYMIIFNFKLPTQQIYLSIIGIKKPTRFLDAVKTVNKHYNPDKLVVYFLGCNFKLSH